MGRARDWARQEFARRSPEFTRRSPEFARRSGTASAWPGRTPLPHAPGARMTWVKTNYSLKLQVPPQGPDPKIHENRREIDQNTTRIHPRRGPDLGGKGRCVLVVLLSIFFRFPFILGSSRAGYSLSVVPYEGDTFTINRYA